ncbi:TPA: hypothetical protein QCX89_004979 [Bacillus cereus]|nr:hypothetical protein [Bacillus cereus]
MPSTLVNLETIIKSINEDDILTRLKQEHLLEEKYPIKRIHAIKGVSQTTLALEVRELKEYKKAILYI